MGASVSGIHLTGIHASRPAGNAVPDGSLYSCTTHGLIYKSDYAGNSWSTWATLGTAGAYVAGGTDVAIADGGTGASTAAAGFNALSPMTTQDDVIIGGASGAGTRLAKGSDGQVLTVDPSTHHLVWATPSSGFSNPMTTKGDVIVGDTGGSPIRKAVGSDGQVLTADAASTGGIKWAAAAGGGASMSVLGYNTAGGSNVAWTNKVCFAKKITLSASSCILSIGFYISMTSVAGTGGAVVVYADSAGSPTGDPLAMNAWAMQLGSGSMIGIVMGATATPGWIEAPVGCVLAAGDYWIGIMLNNQETSWKIYYDGSGTDKEITMTDAGYIDGIGRATVASASRKYSIRANVLA